MKSYNILVILFLTFFLLSCSNHANSQALVKTGAEVLIDKHLPELENRNIGLVMNPTARVKGVHVLDTLQSYDVNIVALFSPEHGFRGEYSDGEVIEDGIDQQTGLPVYSLYGSTKKPTSEMLAGIDLLLFDMQDVGARFYTFNSTMRYVIEAASELGIEVWILDRPNPAGGVYVAGWVLQPEFESMVGSHFTSVAHGMTLGELAEMGIGEDWYELSKTPNVRIIKMEGWERDMTWPDTGLPWIPPSPNLPTFEHAFVYLGTCFIEGTTISEGRGTENPFLTLGAPDLSVNPSDLKQFQKKYSVKIDTISFTPVSITGKSVYPKFENESLKGISIEVDSGFKNPVEFGVEITNYMMKNSNSSVYRDYINLLVGKEIMEGEELPIDWGEGFDQFVTKRARYLLY